MAMNYRRKTMISAYFVIPLVIGIVLCYLWLIHNFWLRHVFSENPAAKGGVIKPQDADLRRGVIEQINTTGNTGVLCCQPTKA